jgi:hypothetical protein
MARNWYYAKDGQRFGPVPFDDLRQLAATGRVLWSDVVVEEGSQTWGPAASVAGLVFGPEAGPGKQEGTTVEAEAALSPEDREKLNGTAAAFLAVPLYMLAVGMMVASLLFGLQSMNAALLRVVLLFYVALVGVGVRSLQCLGTLQSDPFRAVAMGRYVFGIYVLLSVATSVFTEWPRDEGDWLNALGVLLKASSDLGEKLALLIFLQAAYSRLRGARPAYTLEHFWHDATFGWQGKDYGWDHSPVISPKEDTPSVL